MNIKNQIKKETAATLEKIKSTFIERKKSNRAYSLRAFARDLEMSPTLLSLVLSKKRTLSASQVLKMRRIFPHESLSEKTSHPETVAHYDSPEFVNIHLPNEIEHWYELAILDLVTLKNFKSDVNWVAKKLKLTSTQVLSAFEKLLRLGLLTEEDGHFKKAKIKIQIKTKTSQAAIRNIHRALIQKGIESLAHHDQKNFDARKISGIVLAVNPDQLKEAQRRIDAFQQEIADLVTQGECTQLYQLNIQLFSLLEK